MKLFNPQTIYGMYWIIIFILQFFTLSAKLNNENTTLIKRALQKEHEKPQSEKWADAFFGKSNEINYQLASLVELLHTVANNLDNCTVMIIYDSSAEDIDKIILEKLFKDFPSPYIHGRIDKYLAIMNEFKQATSDKCLSYMLFLKDVMKIQEIIGRQRENKVVIISRSSQWRVHEFLSSDVAQNFVNLLIICKSEQLGRGGGNEIPYILYTHQMYVDGLGSSKPRILMSWYKNKLTNTKMPIFPKKMVEGFAGHRFIIAVAEQPPYVIKRGLENRDNVKWDGLEIRLIKFVADILNFTVEFQEAKGIDVLGPGDAVTKIVKEGKVNIGLAGIYLTAQRTDAFEISHGHSQDCAAFISLTSTALPKFRAILGPFHWTVWLALTLTYMFAIFPIAYSDRLTLSHLIKRPEEMENMFWYVFGTFTNCFTFTGKDSWSNTKKTSTRMFIGWYWVFTIIVSACYTGSIIAFVTLPILPKTVDTPDQLISGRFQLGTLDKGGWQNWFENSTDEKINKLFKNIEFLTDVQSGLKNITQAWLWPYAFLGSRDQLDFIIRTNYTTTKKKSVLHISKECFVPFSVSMAFPKNSVYKNIINNAVMRSFQSGLTIKMKNDVDFDVMRSSSGKMLQANSIGKVRDQSAEDRALTLQDTVGMFLLLAFGFVCGGASLLSEWLGGCVKFCKRGIRSRLNSISTNSKIPTPDASNTNASNTNLDFEAEQANSINTINDYVKTNLLDVQSNHNYESSVVVHNESEKEETHDEHIEVEDNSISSTADSSELDYEINKLFNFDHLFGDNYSDVTQDSKSYHSDNFGEVVDDYKFINDKDDAETKIENKID